MHTAHCLVHSAQMRDEYLNNERPSYQILRKGLINLTLEKVFLVIKVFSH